MHDLESVQRKFERLKAAPGDLRIRQVWGREALDLARAKDYTLDVDIQAWRARTGKLYYDNYWDIEPDSSDMARLLRDGFVAGDFFLNLGADEATEEALVLELFDATEPETDGYRSVQEIIGFVRVEPLLAGSLVSWDVVSGALARLTKKETLEVLHEDLDPIDVDNAYRYADASREPPLTDAQVEVVQKLLREPLLGDDDLKVLARFLQLAFAGVQRRSRRHASPAGVRRRCGRAASCWRSRAGHDGSWRANCKGQARGCRLCALHGYRMGVRWSLGEHRKRAGAPLTRCPVERVTAPTGRRAAVPPSGMDPGTNPAPLRPSRRLGYKELE